MTVLAATANGLWPTGELAGRAVVDVVPIAGGGWRALAGGAVWGPGDEEVARLPGPGPDARCLVAVGDDLLIGTDEARLVRLSERGAVGAVESFDAAEGRDGWYTPWGGPPSTRSLSVAPDDGAVYVNVHVGGILRSSDGGQSWVPTIDVDSDVHQVLALGDGRVVAATAYGLAVSRDRGATWSYVTGGLHADYSRAVAVAGDWLLLSSSTGPSTERGAVYRRPVEAGADVPFERCTDWFAGNVDTGSLAGNADGNAAMASPDGTVFVSDDAGASWREVASGLGRVSRLVL
ncbi:MAG: WD40/YVTN/BNR-like repeat-containing protein [Acidimicrobiales bacterium]